MHSSTEKLRRPLVVVPLAIVLVVIGYAVWTHFQPGHDHAHGHDAHGASALSLNDGQRWATDEPLRLGMQRIRDVVAPALVAPDRRTLNQKQAKVMADSMQEHVTYLMQNCKLAPKADAALHVLITELMEGAALVAANPQSEEGLSKLAHALGNYPKYFDHPNWRPLPAPPS